MTTSNIWAICGMNKLIISKRNSVLNKGTREAVTDPVCGQGGL